MKKEDGAHYDAGAARRRAPSAGPYMEYRPDGAVITHYPDGYRIGLGPEVSLRVDGRNAAPEPLQPLLLDEFVAARQVHYSPPHEYARSKAREFVIQLLGKDVDPDELLITTLYINELDVAPQRAHVAYSMTLTEAFMRNWQQEGNGEFFDHLGHLRDYRYGGYPVRISTQPLQLADCFAYEGIYRKTSPQRFDHSTHIPIEPKTFKSLVWNADLQAHYQQSLTRFWDDNGSDYNLLVKAALLKSAYVQHEEDSLSTQDKSLVLASIGLPADQAWETLEFKAFRDAPLSPRITFRELVVYRYTATDIIVIREESTDRLVVYIPGNSSPLHGFDHLQALRNWIALQCRDSRRRKALQTHFKAEDEPDGLWLSGLQTALAGLAAHPYRLNDTTGHWYPDKVIHLGPALWPWPFTHVRKSLQSRLASDGRQLIRTRADAKKATAALALNNAIVATGAIAMVVPVLWIPLTAMSVALIGLGADEVLEGRTLEEQQEGAGRIIFGVLNAAPLLQEGAAAAGRFAASAARTAQDLAPGAADEVGQMINRQSAEQRAAAVARQEQVEVQDAEHARALANETANGRKLRRAREEQQRLARKAHHEQTLDSAIAFGAEPEGLRSLTPELRGELARFEFNAPLDRAGAWGDDDFGAVYKVVHPETEKIEYFARVHSKIYRVERVQAAGRYRIYSSEDPTIKGPYIKRLKGYYSDLDLVPGLRGGDSYIETAPVAESTPEPAKNGITLLRAQPPVTIEIPMDGIEVRAAVDGWGKPAQSYYAMNVPEGTAVRYNADIGGWSRYDGKMLWLDNKGGWRSGSEKAFLKIRDQLESGVRTELYKFPRVPGLPSSPEPIDLTVHQIWLGEKIPNARLIDTIKTNVRKNPQLEFILHIDVDNVAFNGELTRLQLAFKDQPNITVSQLEDESFFSRFLSDTETAVPFRYFRNGHGENLAAASDVLRYRLIHEYGGIYMDCDDVIQASFADVVLKAGPDDVLMGGPVSSPKMSFFGPGNSHFASHAGNPVLKEVQRGLFSRFIDELDTLRELGAARSVAADCTYPYMSKVFEVTGPRLLVDMLKKFRPDYADLLQALIRPRPGVRSLIYLEYLDEANDFYTPFARRLRIAAGAENSWDVPAA